MKTGFNPADARANLEQLAAETAGVDYASLSRMLRRPPAYLSRFVRAGEPKNLRPEECRQLAAFFRVDESAFGED